MRRAALLAVFVVACGSTTEAGPVDTGAAADLGVDAPAGSPNSASITVSVDPGQEKTVCTYVRLTNPEPMYITKSIGRLLPGSHHLIVYKASATEENLTPQPCVPFAGILGGKEDLIGETARPEGITELPKGVGIKIAANQMIKLEAHYINTTKSPLSGKGTWSFEGVPVASAPTMIEAGFFIWGSTKLKIPPKSTWDTGIKFQKGQQGTTAFFMTTHQHSLGTKVTVWPAAALGDVSKPPIVEEPNWAEPRMFMMDPKLEFDGTNGLGYKCEYNNTTDAEVLFGESALEEMCFVAGWYYPTKGQDVCFEGVCPSRK
jgi:hypothetical protein